METKYQEFLLEVGVEEIPAWMIPQALADLKRNLERAFADLRLSGVGTAAVQMFATPRRLVAYCPALPDRQTTVEEMVAGPPKRVAFDANGNPTQAALKFAEKMGTTPQKLKTIATPKGEYVAFRKVSKGRRAIDVLRDAIPSAVLSIPFPKTMHWEGKNGPHFIRPIRNLLVLYGGKVVPCSIGTVAAGRFTFGHRRLGKPKLAVKNFEQYREALRTNGVLLDPEERRARIVQGAENLLRPEKMRLKPNDELLNTLVYLTEHPTPLLGSFDEAYLALPEEVLITVMRGHQKYFAVERDGKMAPCFVAVMETDADRTGVIRHGHERVLRARFKDAQFFWETDGKRTLEERLDLLRTVTFQAKLGSYYEKAMRMQALAGIVITRLRSAGVEVSAELDSDVVKAARLAKCDLTADLVKEFTELQGVIGGLYARREGLSAAVAEAIYDHYKPQSMEDELPRSTAGCIVSLADRMDTLAGCFGVGLVPSGSKDPFGLRRAAQGVIRILAERGFELTLDGLVGAACQVYEDARSNSPDQVANWEQQAAVKDLLPFLEDRLRYYLREVRGFAYDEVNAVLEAGSRRHAKDYNVARILRRLQAVAKIRSTENFEPLAAQFKRIKNILAQARQARGFEAAQPREHLFREEAERRLFARYREVARQSYESYESELKAIAALRPDVDLFFDKILVMAPEEELRNNRLNLLSALLDDLSRIADFSEIIPKEAAEQEASLSAR